MVDAPPKIAGCHTKTLKHNQKIAKYVYFESPIKIANDFYNVILTIERMQGQSPELLDLYDVRIKKNDLAGTNLIAFPQGQFNNTELKSNLSNILFQIAGEIGADNLNNSEGLEGVSV